MKTIENGQISLKCQSQGNLPQNVLKMADIGSKIAHFDVSLFSSKKKVLENCPEILRLRVLKLYNIVKTEKR